MRVKAHQRPLRARLLHKAFDQQPNQGFCQIKAGFRNGGWSSDANVDRGQHPCTEQNKLYMSSLNEWGSKVSSLSRMVPNPGSGDDEAKTA